MSATPSQIGLTGEPETRVELRARRGGLHAWLELTKARLTSLVLLTTAVGFVLAAPGPVEWVGLAWTVLGAGLAAAGVAGMNQRLEVERDALMERTRRRPLPAGTIGRGAALALSLACMIAGPLVLLLAVNPLSAGLTALCEFVYIGLYTPLKVRTPVNTLVGAVCGALPPMIGWAAAAGRLDAGGWVLGAILFVWQMPHFLALAWMYRADYERGGFRMLPAIDATGRVTAATALLYSLALVPTTLMLTACGATGPLYMLGALVLGVGLALAALRFAMTRAEGHARSLFLASVIYLPLLLGLMVFDRAPLPPRTAAIVFGPAPGHSAATPAPSDAAP